jgi:hypothetical protein
MSQTNRQTIAPAPPFGEVGRQTYDTVVGENPRRRGPLQAEEGLGYDPTYSSSFVGGVQVDRKDHVVYETKIAPNARGRLASGQEVPSWAAVDRAMLGSFAQGTSGSEQSVSASPFPFTARDGANPATITDLRGLRAGERPGTTYGRSIPPVNGGRGHKNIADVTEAL